MDDTSQAFKDFYHHKIMKYSGEARVMMGDRMFEAARKLVLASLPDSLADDEKRFHLFLRFYGNEFLPHQKEHIKKIIAAR